MANEKQSLAKKFEHGLEYFIFASRWVQAPIYVALIFAAIAYAWKSVQELVHLLTGFAAATAYLLAHVEKTSSTDTYQIDVEQCYARTAEQ